MSAPSLLLGALLGLTAMNLLGIGSQLARRIRQAWRHHRTLQGRRHV